MSIVKDRHRQFTSKVELIPFSSCWYWKSKQNKKGYGQITINYVTCLAHRVSYQLYIGDIPDGLHVMHVCDNPSCVNPNHLRLGTNQDNINDKLRKGRQYKGNQYIGRKKNV